jgi:hypothetical protein
MPEIDYKLMTVCKSSINVGFTCPVLQVILYMSHFGCSYFVRIWNQELCYIVWKRIN